MEEQIGQAAGRIWQALSKKSGVNVADLPKITGLKSQVAYMGLGWLARESKLSFETKGERTNVSLTQSECVC